MDEEVINYYVSFLFEQNMNSIIYKHCLFSSVDPVYWTYRRRLLVLGRTGQTANRVYYNTIQCALDREWKMQFIAPDPIFICIIRVKFGPCKTHSDRFGQDCLCACERLNRILI